MIDKNVKVRFRRLTDSATGTVATVTKGPIALDVTNQTVKNDAAAIYSVLPGGGL